MNDIHRQSAEVQKANRYFRKEEQKKAEAAAWAEHHTSQAAVLEKTARLKALRLARDAALPTVIVKPKRKTAPRSASK
jgi:hypothetical protein